MYARSVYINDNIDAEWDERQNKRIERSIAKASFHYKSNIESINFDQSRNIDRNLILGLAECSFVEKNENALITSSTGVGKSFLGIALGYQACKEGYRVSHFNTSKLFAKLKMEKADSTYLRELAKIQGQNIIILDDFGLQELDNHNRITLLEIIGKKTIADAILDRLLHQSHRVELHS